MTVIGTVQAPWSWNGGNWVEIQCDYGSLYARTGTVGNPIAQETTFTLTGMDGGKKLFGEWTANGYATWKRIGAMPWCWGRMHYIVDHDGYCDEIKAQYEWKHWVGTYPKENFIIWTKRDGEQFEQLYNEVVDQTEWSEEAQRHFPTHRFEFCEVLSVSDGKLYISIKVYHLTLISEGTYREDLDFSTPEVPNFHYFTFFDHPSTLRCLVHFERYGGSGDVEGSFKSCGQEKIIGDITGDRKVDIKDVARMSGAFGKYITQIAGSPEWWEWQYRDCDFWVRSDGYACIDVKDLGQISSRYGTYWE